MVCASNHANKTTRVGKNATFRISKGNMRINEYFFIKFW